MKRSSQVALLLAGVTTAGASSYALMSPSDCATPERPGVAAPGAINQAPSPCSTSSSRSSSSSHYSGSSRSNSGGSDDRLSSHASSSSSTHASLGGGGTSWGGFGSIGHAFSSSGS